MINQGLDEEALLHKLQKEARIKISNDSDYADLGEAPSRVLRSGGRGVNDKAYKAWEAAVHQRHVELYFGWDKDRYKHSDIHPFPESYADKEFEIPEDEKPLVANKWDLV